MERLIIKAIEDIVIEEKGRPIPSGILMDKVRHQARIDKKSLIYSCIDKLVEKNVLRKTPSGMLVEGYINRELLPEVYRGTIAINSNLDGYIRVKDENNGPLELEAYVNNINLNGAITGDLVEFKYMKDKYTKQNVQHAAVTKILEHNTKFIVGEFQLIGNTYNVLCDDTRNYTKIHLQDTEGLVNGHKILVEIKEYKDGEAWGAVSRVLGHKDDVGVDILSIIAAHNIEIDFTKESLDQANINEVDANDNSDVRRDLKDRMIVTIDPATSKDLDDAVHVKKLDNGKYFLSVSIADVSHYVRYNSPLWNEAINRATSVYLVDRVIPMLPHTLSNNICSLNPQVPRLTLTCDMEIDEQGNYSNIEVYPSVIHSTKRLSYDEVNEYFAGQDKPEWSNELKQMMDWSKELHHILRARKAKDGYIDFEVKEPIIVVDEKCWPIDIVIKERGTAQKMVEDFMICANEGVTINANKLDIPFIYRIHAKPDIARLENFAVEAKKLGFITNKSDFEDMKPNTIARWLDQNKNNDNIALISKLLLRCMQKAAYSTNNVGHFGLSSENYTHFTSPIRRTPDMIVHTLYWMFAFKPSLFSDGEREKFKQQLPELCETSTQKEIEAVQCERDVNQLKFCQYMSKHIGDTFEGTISTVKSFGMFIELDNTVEVLVRIVNIGKDFWKFIPDTNVIMGNRTGKVFTFGNKVTVKIIDVNIPNRQINAIIVGFEPDERPQGNREFKRNNDRKVHRY